MHEEQYDRDYEQHIGDLGGDGGYAGHSEHARNQRDNEKHQRVIKHEPSSSGVPAERSRHWTEQKLCRNHFPEISSHSSEPESPGSNTAPHSAVSVRTAGARLHGRVTGDRAIYSVPTRDRGSV